MTHTQVTTLSKCKNRVYPSERPFLFRESMVSGCAAADKRGQIKSLQVGPVMHCLIVFTWSSLGSFKKGTWSYRCPYALIFVFLTLIFSEMKVTQMKCDWGRKMDGSETCQLHSEALILIWLPCGWENIFRIQYARLQNKCINIGIFPTDGCVPLGEKNSGNIFAIPKLNIKHQWINLRNTKAYMKNPLQLYSEA